MIKWVICLLLVSNAGHSQQFKDTVFLAGEHSCSCKYNFNDADDKSIFDLKGVDARYPGGEDAWKKFLKKNLDKGFKGKDKVDVRFTISKRGELSGYELMSRSPAQKFQEAVRVLKLSGNWFPSVQDGFCVGSAITITFEL